MPKLLVSSKALLLFFFFFFILAMQVRRYKLIQEYIQGGEVVYKVVKGI